MRKPYELTDEDYNRIDLELPGGINAPQNIAHAAQKKLLEWLNNEARLEQCDPDVMPYFNEYYWIDKDIWQSLLKDFGL